MRIAGTLLPGAAGRPDGLGIDDEQLELQRQRKNVLKAKFRAGLSEIAP